MLAAISVASSASSCSATIHRVCDQRCPRLESTHAADLGAFLRHPAFGWGEQPQPVPEALRLLVCQASKALLLPTRPRGRLRRSTYSKTWSAGAARQSGAARDRRSQSWAAAPCCAAPQPRPPCPAPHTAWRPPATCRVPAIGGAAAPEGTPARRQAWPGSNPPWHPTAAPASLRTRQAWAMANGSARKPRGGGATQQTHTQLGLHRRLVPPRLEPQAHGLSGGNCQGAG
jgi:hypothetical protein